MKQWNVIDMALPLRSWTRNVPLVEGLELISMAEDGMSVPDWRARADDILPHTDPGYRQTLLRLVQRMFLDVNEAGTHILETPYLRLVREGDEKRQRDLFFGRYALAHPWCLLAARRLILPRIDRLGDEAEVTTEEWDAFVSTYMEASASDASRRKTRSTITGVFQHLGVLEREGSSSAPTRPRRATPDPLAFGWMVADQLSAQLIGRATRDWAATTSDAAQLFAIDPEDAQALIRKAVGKGELRAVKIDGERGVTPAPSYAHAMGPAAS
jgi:hypothetical protein